MTFPASNHPQLPFQWQSPEPRLNHAQPSRTTNTFLSSLTPYCPATASSQVRQNYSTELEAAINLLVNLHLQASYTYLSLGFFFDCSDVAPEGGGHCFGELTMENPQSAKPLLKMQNQSGSHTLFQDTQKASQDEHIKTCGCVEASIIMEKNLILGEEVKLIKKIGYHLANLRKLAGLGLGWVRNPLQKLTLQHN